MLKFASTISIFLLSILQAFATDPYPRNPNIDIQHYRFTIEINDGDNTIAGTTEVSILFKNSTPTFELDLVGKSPDGKGLTVSSVMEMKNPLKFL